MECGQCGAPGVSSVFPVVVEFKSNRENVPTRHPAMGELTALEIWPEREIATLHLVFPVKYVLIVI